MSGSKFRTRFLEPRSLCFLSLSALLLVGFRGDLANLIRFSFIEDLYSYIILIPIVSLALVAQQRKSIFSGVRWALLPGMALMAVGLAGFVVQKRVWQTDPATSLSTTTACVLAIWIGAFTLCYGTRASRAAIFPLLFLLLMVPIPERLLHSATLLLQKASCQLTYLLMTLGGGPVLRQGFFLFTPEGGIEVAEQCSSIHSTLGLLIGCLVATHLFLRSAWRKSLLTVSVIPVSIFKNALRIITLYWLGVHADHRLLTGDLHRYGGIPFSLVALGILGPLMWLLRKSEVSPRQAIANHRTPSP